MMASDGKKTKTESTPKKAASATDKSTSGTEAAKAADSPKVADSPKADAPKTDAAKTDAAKTDATKSDAPKAEAGENAGAAPKGYSRGEGQKPVTQAYKDNWNAIFATKRTRKKNTKKKMR